MHHNTLPNYRALVPMALLLLGELLAFAWLAPLHLRAATPISLGITLLVLLAGLLPALVRPAAASNLVGCLGVVLAGVLWQGPYLLSQVPTFDALAAALDDNTIRLGLLHVALLAPLTVHLAARFPLHTGLSSRIISAYYLLVLGCTLATFALPSALRHSALLLLALSLYAGFALAAAQLYSTIQRAQPAAPRAAQQARLLLLSLTIAEAPLLLLPFGSLISLLIPYELIAAAQVALPIGVAYILLRNDLFGADQALRRALDYTTVSFGLLVIYFGLTALLTQLSRDLGGTWGLAATILSVIAAAAAFTPLRRISQRLIDQVFYPERMLFGQAVSTARDTLAQVVQRAAVITLLEDDLPRQLGASQASLVLRPDFAQPAAHPPGGWGTLLLVGGQPIGSYWLGPRHSRLPYAADEQAQLQGLLQQAALALAYAETFDTLVQLNAELEERVTLRSNHLLAQQRELAALEERQRLARELHDSLKQTLFSLGLGLRSARARVHTDPPAAMALLQQHEQAVLSAQAELGELLTHLRTPAGGTADLVVLLNEHINWLGQQHNLQISPALPAALVLPMPLPHELSQLAKEALHNVLRHSGSPSASLSLCVERGLLELRISDQGHGFDPARPAPGHGLRSMYERAALLGGTLTIQSAPGKGTSVWLQLKLAE